MKHLLTEPFIVINGDILTNLDFKKLYDYHIKYGADLTMVSKTHQVPLHYGVVKPGKNNSIAALEEKPILYFDINAGIYVLNPRILNKLNDNQHYLMTDLVRDAIRDGDTVVHYPLTDYWLDLGIMEDYQKAQHDVTSGTLNFT